MVDALIFWSPSIMHPSCSIYQLAGCFYLLLCYQENSTEKYIDWFSPSLVSDDWRTPTSLIGIKPINLIRWKRRHSQFPFLSGTTCRHERTLWNSKENNLAFENLNFAIFHQFLSPQISKTNNCQNGPFLAFSSNFFPTQNVKVHIKLGSQCPMRLFLWFLNTVIKCVLFMSTTNYCKWSSEEKSHLFWYTKTMTMKRPRLTVEGESLIFIRI